MEPYTPLGARQIQPRPAPPASVGYQLAHQDAPASAIGQQLLPSEGQTGKKRGRPSREVMARRRREAEERGEIYPLPKKQKRQTNTSFEETGMSEQSAVRGALRRSPSGGGGPAVDEGERDHISGEERGRPSADPIGSTQEHAGISRTATSGAEAKALANPGKQQRAIGEEERQVRNDADVPMQESRSGVIRVSTAEERDPAGEAERPDALS